MITNSQQWSSQKTLATGPHVPTSFTLNADMRTH